MAATPTSAPRSWSSLLTERWHRSSRVVFWTALVVLLLCNIPGQYVQFMHYELGYPFYLEDQWVHGWPGTYLVRDARFHHADPVAISFSSVYVYGPTLSDCFSPWSDVEHFRWWVLPINIVGVVLTAFVAGAVFEVWRRQRSKLWQIHLRDCLVASLLVSLFAAWGISRYRPWRLEQGLQYKRKIDGLSPPLYVTRQQRLTLLHLCLPRSTWYEPFNPPLELHVSEQPSWQYLRHFPEARHVLIEVRATTDDLAHLNDLPNLDTISFDYIYTQDWDNTLAELPPLPRLRGLYITIPAHGCRRLDRLTDLTDLRITNTEVDDEALRELGQLRNLRRLSLGGLKESADLSFLPKMPQLIGLDLDGCELNDGALHAISQCSSLEELSLTRCEVDDRCIPHLIKLTRLRELNLRDTKVVDIELIGRALPKCKIFH